MTTNSKFVRREVVAELVEATPGQGALAYWLLASPMLLFLAWLWVDLFHYFARPTASFVVNAVLSLPFFIIIVVLPLGYAMHRLVLSLPMLFQHAGWEVQPLEPVAEAEQYLVRYRFQRRRWAALDWHRIWLRAGQGWVFLEIATILIGAVLIIPLYFSARDFGFGQ
jgi:hypothetical protein